MPLSEIAIKPGKSKIYLRLLIVVTLLSISLVAYSSLSLTIKIVIVIFLLCLVRMNKLPHHDLIEIKYVNNQWTLILNQGEAPSYPTAEVLFQNTLFLLIQFISTEEKRFVVLFCDQLTSHQLRSLYLISRNK